jgi:hypothetical protein
MRKLLSFSLAFRSCRLFWLLVFLGLAPALPGVPSREEPCDPRDFFVA